MRNSNPDEAYDYTNTPAYRRKVRREQRKKAGDAAFLETQGPVTIVLFYILDFIYQTVESLFYMFMNFSSVGFDYFYQFFYSAYGGFIPNTEKFGYMISFRIPRYLITLLVPPLGVYLSKGLMGWFNIIITFILTYIHFFLGAIYAFVITHRNRYADRYEKVEYERLMAIREYIKSCTNQGDEVGKIIDKDSKAVLITIVFLIAIFALLFYAFNYM
tara:strand:- start:26 stop:673 length:648 start_codon:yes stop_codon:yes gene_type:complete